jgi:hypothetical protein
MPRPLKELRVPVGSSSIYRNFSVIAVAGLFLSGLFMFGIAVVSGIQLSGELILGTALILVESSLAISETMSRSRVEPAKTNVEKREAIGTPILLGASQFIDIELPESKQE